MTVEVITEGSLAEVIRDHAVEGDSEVIEEIFIDDEDNLELKSDLIVKMLRYTAEKEELKNVVSKSISASSQSSSELGVTWQSINDIVEPPYPPELIADFLEADEVTFRCVKTKVVDSVGRAYNLEASNFVDGSLFDPSNQTEEDKKNIDEEIRSIRNFIDDCNDVIGFDGVLERAAMDHEGIGWAAIEVIRSMDMKIRKIAHIPASRVRVLKGWRGFVELGDGGRVTYYQPFGEKIVSPKRKDIITGEFERYNPFEDGPIDVRKLQWNFISRTSGDRTDNLSDAANELLWLPKHHSNTIYYGYSDTIPALGHILGNIYIRDYLLQFFEHNTVPRYAIIIRGAKLAPVVKDAILKYFRENVKGKHHKTLLIPIPATKGEVDISFEKLDADSKEGSFQITKKNNAQSIMTSHGVSPAIIGVNDTANLGSGKGLSQAEIYKDRIITPLQRKWGHALTKLFRLGLGIRYVSLKFDPLDIRDREAEMRVLLGYLEKSILTINQIRQKANLGDPFDGGDRPFILTGQGIVFLDELDNLKKQKVSLVEEESKF